MFLFCYALLCVLSSSAITVAEEERVSYINLFVFWMTCDY